MLSAPDDLPEELLAATLARAWGMRVASLDYRPLGFGSHHWEVVDGEGKRWFATVDELQYKRHSLNEPLDMGFERLSAALDTARRLREHGLEFVVGPVPAVGGELVVRVGSRFAGAVYPYVEGESFAWGEFPSAEHERAVVDVLARLHATPAPVAKHVFVDELALPHRDELEAALAPDGKPVEQGPYTLRALRLIASNAAPIRELLGRYDGLAVVAGDPTEYVVTHGEPHPGNTMRTADGWLLIDWDTALLAPAERDLWRFEGEHGRLFPAYTDATGHVPKQAMLDLYRLGWDLADLAMYVNQFRAPHAQSPNDETSWTYMQQLVSRLVEVSQRPAGVDTAGR